MFYTSKLQALQPTITQAERDTGLDSILSVCGMGKTLTPARVPGSYASLLSTGRGGHLHAQASTPLTVTLLLSFALLVSLIARAAVQAPVQKAPQQCLLLARQFCGGRGDKAAPVLLKAVLPLPAGWGESRKPWSQVAAPGEPTWSWTSALIPICPWLSLCVLENTHKTGIV